jgi:histidinol-phosphate aminotransferase
MTYRYERVDTPASGLRLHLNENTAGCSPSVLDVLRNLTREDAALYPDYTAAVEACARSLRVDASQLVLTNGLDEGILAMAVVALREGSASEPHEAIVVVPAFDMYAACADGAGGRVVAVSLGERFEFSVERLLAALTPATRVVFLTNPNNPTGRRLPAGAVAAVAEAAPQAMVLVDEAYADFGGFTFIADPAFGRLENVIVGRTFAKAYGLAGLRAGALVGSARALEPLRRVIPPYSLNACAALALPAALGDREYYDWYVREVAESRTLLYEALSRLGVEFWESDANFVLARFGKRHRSVIDGLAARRIYVRDRSADPGCAGCIRITTGVVEHTRICITALEEVLCGAA